MESTNLIDPEQLVALTVWIGSDHVRVNAVARAWLQRYDDFIARPRLKNLLATETDELKTAVAVLLSPPATKHMSDRAADVRTDAPRL